MIFNVHNLCNIPRFYGDGQNTFQSINSKYEVEGYYLGDQEQFNWDCIKNKHLNNNNNTGKLPDWSYYNVKHSRIAKSLTHLPAIS